MSNSDFPVLKMHRRERAMPMTDRISTLPDELLCHILSFLPTKIAVATSLLSKRWKQVWISVPTLYFNDLGVEGPESYLRFNQFVDTVMQSRHVQQPIKSFHLECYSTLCDRSNVYKWVNDATQWKVEHLEVSLLYKFYLPSGIFSCRTLTVLKLRSFSLKTILSVDLPSLKVLHLKDFYFKEHGYLMEILSGCPILEDLQTKYLTFDCNGSRREAEGLPKLVRANINFSDIPLKVMYNVEFLRIIEIGGNYGLNPDHQFKGGIPVFHNLTYMELIFVDYTYWHWVVEVLKHCPKLQNLVIDKMEMIDIDVENGAYTQLVPECLQLHLRTCTLRCYQGLEGELLFAGYIMKNARVLQTMTICSASFSPEEKLEMLKELSLCTRKSVTCELSFK